MVPDTMRDPGEVIETAAEVIERTKRLLRSTDDRLRISRLQVEQSRRLLERFALLETDLKKRIKGRGR